MRKMDELHLEHPFMGGAIVENKRSKAAHFDPLAFGETATHFVNDRPNGSLNVFFHKILVAPSDPLNQVRLCHFAF